MMMALAAVLTAVLAVASATALPLPAREAGPLDTLALELVPVADGFDDPLFVTAAPGDPGRLYVVEQPGAIRLVEADGSVAAEPFLDLSAKLSSGGERGLLGLAFHPGYADNGRLDTAQG